MDVVLTELAYQLDSIPAFPYLVTLHVMNVSAGLRNTIGPKPVSWYYSLILCIFASFGGSTLGYFLLNKHFPILASPYFIPAAIVIWYFMMQKPLGDLLYKIFSFPPIRIMAICASAIFSQRSVTSCVDMSQEIYPGALFSALIIATVSGVGGLIFITLDIHLRNTGAPVHIGGYLKLTLGLVLVYMFLTDAFGLFWGPFLGSKEARLITTTLLITNNVLSYMLGPFNPFSPFEGLFFRVVAPEVTYTSGYGPKKQQQDQPEKEPKKKNN
eukprot:TRINITY_DN591_c0_g1_i1.p1 TRINITY_DN591_c0_g1~~TRINITY_DN591_c0_g1_i1.p1  ORF type:complete len:286 (+),score=43.05 TRINITY_DN591_c0_g1_i1:51-860(+)